MASPEQTKDQPPSVKIMGIELFEEQKSTTLERKFYLCSQELHWPSIAPFHLWFDLVKPFPHQATEEEGPEDQYCCDNLFSGFLIGHDEKSIKL